jgi:hypothetical protein
MTEWRDIPTLPHYLISSEGQVKHKEREALRKLGEQRGYLWCGFVKDGKHIMRTVHSLVAEAFLGPRPDGHQVRHLDGDRSNNRVENLCYGSALENAQDRERHGTTARGERGGNARLSDAAVVLIRELYAETDATQYELAGRFNISQAQVNNIILGKQRRRAA